MKNGKKSLARAASKHLAILIVFLIIANASLSILMSAQSSAAMRAQLQGRMLDISNTAAAMLDGDVLRTVTPINTP